jgi:microcystin-dependent protein
MIAKSFTFTNNTVANPSEINQNFDDLVAAIKAAHHRDTDGTKISYQDIASGWGLVPTKGIIMWNDTIANIPTGYVFCNGANATPDLRSRFILGVDSDAGTYPLHTIGGESTHTLSAAEMPWHDHGGSTGGQTANHNHNENPEVRANQGGGADRRLSFGGQVWVQTESDRGYAIQTGYANSDHAHAVSGAGSGGAHNNLPPFHALVFIMKS